jgi:hypothetical protein
MSANEFNRRLAEIPKEVLPLPGKGNTAERHRRLFEIGREDLSLAKLAEAHWDAVAILTENGREPAPNALYAVWASEIPGQPVQLNREGGKNLRVVGRKMFCSGLGIVDRALVIVGSPDPYLVEIDLKNNTNAIEMNTSDWKTETFVRPIRGPSLSTGLKYPDPSSANLPGTWIDQAFGTGQSALQLAGPAVELVCLGPLSRVSETTSIRRLILRQFMRTYGPQKRILPRPDEKLTNHTRTVMLRWYAPCEFVI